MRLWHYELLPYLPDLQFKGQLRELVLIMHDWRDKGETNHLLINKIMNYDKANLLGYWNLYRNLYYERYNKSINKYHSEFVGFCGTLTLPLPFLGWHNMDYLRICMANLAEKHFYGIGKSRITDEEWQVLINGYKKITGEDYTV